MPNKQRTYFCIDMKSFYASVECAERGYNPFDTNLVVADLTRGKNALCLAITPKLKSQGVKNRCRLSEIPGNVKYEVASPRMALYIEYTADIYSLYLDYFDSQDIHVYSIDESFIDVTDYLKIYQTDAVRLAKKLMNEIVSRYRIPSTTGIGTNLYLAKVALDITAKKAKDHVGYLDEELYSETLWEHRPITDFWMVASGTERRLNNMGVYDMRGITRLPTELLYKKFGKDAELLIDHAWGRESCLMKDIKNYKSKTKSVSFSQILPRNYTFKEARTVMHEMLLNGTAELMKRKFITQKISIFVGYTYDEHEATGGSAKMRVTTNLSSFIVPTVLDVFDKTTHREIPIRRLGISFNNLIDDGWEGYDLFTDPDAVEKEKALSNTVLSIRNKYGKNAVLNGINYMSEATQRERNGFIGGHRAGNDDT